MLFVGFDLATELNPAAVDWWYERTEPVYLVGALLGFAGVMIAISTVSYYFLERPALRALRNWQKSRSAQEPAKA